MRTSRDETISASESTGGEPVESSSGPRPVALLVEPAKLTSPCHGASCCGGPARVWCPECGRSFQADELAATTTPVA